MKRWHRIALAVLLAIVAAVILLVNRTPCSNGSIPRLYCMEGEK